MPAHKDYPQILWMLIEQRDEPAARAFFEKAIGSSGIPDKVTMDKSGANKAGIDTINLHLTLLFILDGVFTQVAVRQIKYLNNMVEQDHRGIKTITKYTLGFKSFQSAEATIAGIELHRMLKKGQMKNTGKTPAWKQFCQLAA
ncbi:DDE-type integrase/transposase/recombinase [Legionella israelensis]|uniref:Transposase n=1 Tax=Legionella israelensis TaxID=454 RepID=A0A0W0VJE7_9GAMM|nr:transposase [Legionella israelensis]SCY39738.1 DDE domain-containing protein [Legionella israelensis DSM 19235]STX58718.1 transposase [Legionella israelensis]